VAEPSLLEFPCEFPLKIMGAAVDGFAQAIAAVVLEHAPDFETASIEMRASSGGKYLSLTCTVRATSQPQLDALYRALTAHPLVKVVL
jgi:putative lipoic acid-binding regulatory protein